MATTVAINALSKTFPDSKGAYGVAQAVGKSHTQHIVCFEIDSDSDSESAPEKPKPSKFCPTTITGRPIAGGRRVLEYRSRGASGGGHGAKFYQSITAMPAFSGSSFEEMRLECYVQSVVASGRPPQAVDAVKSPMAVIPPVFNAFCELEMETREVVDDVAM